MQSRQSTLPKAVLALLCLMVCASVARAQARGPCPLPAPTGYDKYVTDTANIIDQATKDRLSAMLNELKDKADIEFAVVTVPTTGGQAPFDYSLAIARCWGIGSSEGEKNGLLLFVAVADRKYQIQVSRHLEGDLPDGLVGEIGRRMREPFKQNDYSGGLMAAVQTFIATLEEKRGFKIEGTDSRYAYRPRATRTRGAPASGSIGIGGCCIIAVVLIIIFALMSRGGRGRRGGGGWGGGGGLLNAIVLGSILNQMGGRRSSGWGGGGGGGSSSGWGGGGFGGFGGGGDFGGGGAGGSW